MNKWIFSTVWFFIGVGITACILSYIPNTNADTLSSTGKYIIEFDNGDTLSSDGEYIIQFYGGDTLNMQTEEYIIQLDPDPVFYDHRYDYDYDDHYYDNH